MVVPLAFEAVGGWNGFVENVSPSFFAPTNGEYTWLFLGAFALYNSIFIGGNWAYVQRYTSVKNPNDARKVGYLFAALYVISPLIWMLPPMLYRALNADLSGLENEGAYLLMCKEVLPVGMLGLMLGGMVFATASSVNTTLNLSAAVFTNDIYKQFKSQVTDGQLMRMAKLSTFLFGLGTILVAMLVPAAGGIVEVVLSIGAVAGCSLYGPPIWALFSRWHTGKSILTCTLISLVINLFFKFIAPRLLQFQLDRAEEMLVGCVTPFVLLLAYDVWARAQQRQSPDFLRYQEIATEEPKSSKMLGALDNQNEYGWKVLSWAMGAVGILVIGLGFIAQNASFLVISMGVTIGILALLLNRRRDYLKKKRLIPRSGNQNKIYP
jgi:Na+/proline symporter